MTNKKALATATARWGKTAIVRAIKEGCYVGQHGEFIQPVFVASKERTRSDGKIQPSGHYWCDDCQLFHVPAKTATCYMVGKIMLGMFAEVRGEGLTWEDAFKAADRFDNRFKVAAS